MKYCPECRDEFQDWVKTCPDCGVPLVDRLPPETEVLSREGDLVLLDTAPNQLEAELWKNILEDNGVHSMIKVSESTNLYISPFSLRHKLYVLEPDFEKAREILDSIEPATDGDV